jgi:MFS family permease
MFLPQVLTAIVASVLGGSLARRFGTKRVYLAGLVANLASMALLILSQLFTSDQPVAYGLLLGATACLGAGFGLATPALNSFTAVFTPPRSTVPSWSSTRSWASGRRWPRCSSRSSTASASGGGSPCRRPCSSSCSR